MGKDRGWKILFLIEKIVKVLFIWVIPIKALYDFDYSREFDNAGWSFWACFKNTWRRWWL